MTDQDATRQVGPAARQRGWLARNAMATLVAGAVVLAMELGVFFLARAMGANLPSAIVATLAAMTALTVLAAPALAAGGRDVLGALLRGGVVADAGAVALLTIYVLTRSEDGGLGFVTICKIYGVLVSVTLLAVAAVCVPRRPSSRAMAAILVATGLAVLLASPIWISAHLADSPGAADVDLATWAVRVNPFWAVCDAAVGDLAFQWATWGSMYEWTRLVEYVMPRETAWWETCGLALAGAAGLAIVAIWRRRGGDAGGVSRDGELRE